MTADRAVVDVAGAVSLEGDVNPLAGRMRALGRDLASASGFCADLGFVDADPPEQMAGGETSPSPDCGYGFLDAEPPSVAGIASREDDGGIDVGSDGATIRHSKRFVTKRQRHAEALARDAEESLQFQLKEVLAGKCMALKWNHGRGQLQCENDPMPGKDLCRAHRNCTHGRVRGAIPFKKLNEFRKRALQPEKESDQWYARHLMWSYALAAEPSIEYLHELSDANYEKCLQSIQVHLRTNKSLQGKYERGAGVRYRDDRLGGGRFGTERERYNGKDGGQAFRWYSRAVFNTYLARMGVSEESCSEKELSLIHI